jgi:hypothetical protein
MLTLSISVIKNPPASKCEFGWMKARPIPHPGQPFTIFLLGAAPRTVFLGEPVSGFHSPSSFLTILSAFHC